MPTFVAAVTVDVFETDTDSVWLCMCTAAPITSLCLQLLSQQLVNDLVMTILPAENE
jgi:hypothetical protein